MSDRIKGFYVALRDDVKDEDFDKIANAVGLIKGVLYIKKFVTDGTDFLNRARIKNEIKEKILKLLD